MVSAGPLARSSLQTSLLLGLRLLTQGALLILLTRLFGPARYGAFAATSSLAVVLGLLPNLGAGYVMLSRKARDEAAVADVWRYAWPLTLVLGALLTLVYLGLGHAVVRLPFTILLALAGAELLAMPFCMLCSFALQAHERVPLSQFVQWLPLGLRVFAALPCFALEPEARLSMYVWLQCIASIMGSLIGLGITTRHVSLRWSPRLPDAQELGTGTSYAAMNLVAMNPTELDKIIAVRVVGAHEAGIYAAAARVMISAVTPVTGMLLAAQPRLFRHALAPNAENRRLIRMIGVTALGWGVFAGLTMAACSPVLRWLFGAAFTEAAQLMPWLAASSPLLALRLSMGTVLVALGHPLERLAFEVFGVIMLLAATLLLGPPLAGRGLALAMVAAESGMAVLGIWLVSRCLRLQASVAL